MQFNAQERRDLAAFFAKRFPQPCTRARMSRAVGVTPEGDGSTSSLSGWTQLLARLEEEERLHALALVAAREDVHDENLQQVCAVLAGDRPGLVRRIGGARVLGILGSGLAAAAALTIAVLSGAEVPPAAHAEALSGGGPPAAPVAVAPERRPVAPEAAPEAAPPAAPAPAPAASPEPAVAAAAPESSPSDPVDPAHANGRCTVEGGGLVGYWYAGRQTPGAQGQTITVERAVRVRADFPDTHNGFNARAPIRCFLAPGDQVTLSAAPLHVPGDAWWVPLHSGDLTVAR